MSDQASQGTRSASRGTAVVTGASAGIGKVYAERLAGRGYDLILVARRADRLDALARSLRVKYGVAVQNIVADLGDAADLDRVAAAITGDQSITLLVNNAGVSTLAPVAQTSRAAMDAMIKVNVEALAYLSFAILPVFKARDRGAIINIASVLSFHTLPFSSIYSGTKGYVLNFTRGLQEEVAGSNVVVQLVLPASTATDLWELSGVPLSQLDQASIMTTEDCVDAALAGFDQGEAITLPSVEDSQLWADYDAARLRLLAASQTGKPASRYRVGGRTS